jgi:MtN3 and saliva related transmembrane protein
MLSPAALDVLGYVAGLLTTLAFIPQAVQTWRTRRADGVSLGMYVVFVIGVTLWFIYGCVLGSWPLILANGVTLLLAGFILAMKIRYG